MQITICKLLLQSSNVVEGRNRNTFILLVLVVTMGDSSLVKLSVQALHRTLNYLLGRFKRNCGIVFGLKAVLDRTERDFLAACVAGSRQQALIHSVPLITW